MDWLKYPHGMLLVGFRPAIKHRLLLQPFPHPGLDYLKVAVEDMLYPPGDECLDDGDRHSDDTEHDYRQKQVRVPLRNLFKESDNPIRGRIGRIHEWVPIFRERRLWHVARSGCFSPET
jgi:hypothetical protein